VCCWNIYYRYYYDGDNCAGRTKSAKAEVYDYCSAVVLTKGYKSIITKLEERQMYIYYYNTSYECMGEAYKKVDMGLLVNGCSSKGIKTMLALSNVVTNFSPLPTSNDTAAMQYNSNSCDGRPQSTEITYGTQCSIKEKERSACKAPIPNFPVMTMSVCGDKALLPVAASTTMIASVLIVALGLLISV